MEQLLKGVVACVTYGLLGLVLFAISFKIMITVTPFSVRHEIEEDHNSALAIIMASMIIGISIILAAAIVG